MSSAAACMLLGKKKVTFLSKSRFLSRTLILLRIQEQDGAGSSLIVYMMAPYCSFLLNKKQISV
jgi:hypothetical protein